jgi:hypothetical protein
MEPFLTWYADNTKRFPLSIIRNMRDNLILEQSQKPQPCFYGKDQISIAL